MYIVYIVEPENLGRLQLPKADSVNTHDDIIFAQIPYGTNCNTSSPGDDPLRTALAHHTTLCQSIPMIDDLMIT